VTPTQRTPELVTREIQREREELARAVSHLRTELKAATDVRTIVRTKWPQLAVAAGLAAGVIAARRVVRRRRERERDPVVLARIGRFLIVDRS
jgi:hypothetical protein